MSHHEGSGSDAGGGRGAPQEDRAHTAASFVGGKERAAQHVGLTGSGRSEFWSNFPTDSVQP